MNYTKELLAIMVLFSAGAKAYDQLTATPEGAKELDNLRNTRYCEVLLVNRHFPSLTAAVYSTIGLNDCPAEKLASLDISKVKKEFRVTRVILYGPRYLVMDRSTLRIHGKIESFDGLEMRLVAQVKATKNKAPYSDITVDRQTQSVFESGRQIYELLSPEGHVYVMQSYSQERDKDLNEQGLLTLEDRLKLPKGWQYRVRKLDQDLVVRPEGAKAHVLLDDVRDSYQRVK